jgi:hypothetical protein
MAADDALNGGQSYSGAFKLFGQMETLKDAEKLVCVLMSKPAPLSLTNTSTSCLSGSTQPISISARVRMLVNLTVGNKVDNDQSQHGTVSVTYRKRVDLPSNVPTLRVLPDFCDDLLDELI